MMRENNEIVQNLTPSLEEAKVKYSNGKELEFISIIP